MVALVDLADAIFTDENGQEEEELSFPKFMEVVLNLRGSNHATVKDIVDLRKFIRKTMARSGSISSSSGQFRASIRDTVPLHVHHAEQNSLAKPTGQRCFRTFL